MRTVTGIFSGAAAAVEAVKRGSPDGREWSPAYKPSACDRLGAPRSGENPARGRGGRDGSVTMAGDRRPAPAISEPHRSVRLAKKTATPQRDVSGLKLAWPKPFLGQAQPYRVPLRKTRVGCGADDHCALSVGERSRPDRAQRRSAPRASPTQPQKTAHVDFDTRAGAPSFLQTFPNFCGSNAKLFQELFWRFCEFSRGYNRSKPKVMVSKFFGLGEEYEKAVRG